MTPAKKVQSRATVKNMLGGSIAALLILISITFYGFSKQDETVETARWVLHTQKVIAELQQLEALVYVSMTAQRGYIITGQDRYVELFNKNHDQLKDLLNSTARLTRDNGFQQDNFFQLRHRIAELRNLHLTCFEFVRNKQQHKAVELVASGKGQGFAEAIKIDIVRMIEHEEILLVKRLVKNEEAHTLTNTIIVTSSTMAIAFIIVVLLLMYREFTRRLKIQEDLARASELQEAILTATPFALVTIDNRGQITLFNPAAESLLGYQSEEVLGRNPGLWHVPEETAAYAYKLSERFGTRISVNEAMTYLPDRDLIESSIWTYVRKDNSEIKVSLTLSPLRTSSGEIYGYLGISYDITKQLEYETNLIQAREQALAGTRAKSEFLANMSHEIRTPMNAIMGMAELLIEADLNEEQRKYVEIFQRAGDSLLNIINDILDLSKIEAGQFELDRMPFKLTGIVQKSVEIIALKAHQKNLELAVDIEENLGDSFIGDPNRIRQILLNLLGNSIKFTKKGEVLLRLKGRKISEKVCEVTFEVQDTGIGMSEENVEKLFERFAQADSGVTKEFGGTGLGLSITKRLVELMKGDVKVQSTPGVGSKFTATIQLEMDASPTTEKKMVDLKNTKILIVDDTKTNRLITRKLLEHIGAVVEEADSGPAGLDLLVEHNKNGAPFQMVLLDSKMPGMDGFEVAQLIQKSGELSGTIIMMLTSDNRPVDLHRVRQLGLKSYLIKPILKVDLIEALTSASQLTPAPAASTPLGPQTPTPVALPVVDSGTEKTLRILLVDDNDENRLVIRSFLKSRPWKIDEAKNGLEAVEQFKKETYDIVFMDMQMPIMDGYTATGEIRKYEKDSSLQPRPILALTAYALKEEVDKSYTAGCSGHLSKPISKTTLLKAIDDFTSEIEITVDPDLADLIPGYLAGRETELQKLYSALEEENYAVIQALGHKLRGSAGSYGFTGLSEVGKELEENAKAQGRANIEKALSQYQNYLKKVKVKY